MVFTNINSQENESLDIEELNDKKLIRSLLNPFSFSLDKVNYNINATKVPFLGYYSPETIDYLSLAGGVGFFTPHNKISDPINSVEFLAIPIVSKPKTDLFN